MRQHERYPRVALHPEFLDAVYADARGICRLAPLAGWAAYHKLSTILNLRRVPRTPLTAERLQKLAELVGYTGEVFRD